MWKDFFYFSKGERRAVLFLSTLLFVLVCIWLFLPDKEGDRDRMDQTSAEDIENFLAGVREAERKKEYRPLSAPSEKQEAVLFPFDPNTVDSVEWVKLGLSPFVARNIAKYRKKGGSFRTADDFSRIYGISPDEFEKLKPYIRIPEREQEIIAIPSVSEEKRDSLVSYKFPEGTLVDVNVADTAELKKIPGIGSGIAHAIVAYREQLGGFYDLSQLREIEYVNAEMMQWFRLGNIPLRQINANEAGLDKLRAHPYLNFYQAKVIIEYRKKKGKLKSLSQLSLYEEFTEKDLERLAHYLVFE